MLRSNIGNIFRVSVYIVFLVLIVFSPSIHFISYIEFHDCQRVIQLLLLGLVTVEAIISYPHPEIHISKPIQLGMLSVLILGIISTLFSISSRFSTIEWSVFIALGYLAFFVAVRYKANPEALTKQLCYALWGSIVLYMVSFYTGYLTAILVGKQLVWPYPFYGFSNIRIFQQYQMWGLGLICLPLLTSNTNQNLRNWLYIGLAAWWILLFYAASRGALIAWSLATIATAMIYKNQIGPFLRIQLIAATSGLLAYLILFKAIPNWIAASASSSASNVITTATIFRDTVSDRTDLWNAAYVMIKDFPLFGVGPMHFYFYNPFGTHPHNSIIQIAAEWGLPATIIMLGIIVYAFKCWFKQFGPTGVQNKDPLNQQLAIILFFTIIANGAYSLVDGVIVMPISQVLMFTMIGLMIGQYVSGDWYPTKTEPVKKFHFRPVLAGVTLIFLVWSVMPELVRGLTSYDRYLQPGERAFSMAPNTINPRIWMQQRRPEPTSSQSAN